MVDENVCGGVSIDAGGVDWADVVHGYYFPGMNMFFVGEGGGVSIGVGALGDTWGSLLYIGGSWCVWSVVWSGWSSVGGSIWLVGSVCRGG